MKSAEVLSTEPATELFIESGPGTYAFSLGQTTMRMFRQVGTGHVLVMSANLLGRQSMLELDLSRWSLGERLAIRAEIGGAIVAARATPGLTADQRAILTHLSALIESAE